MKTIVQETLETMKGVRLETKVLTKYERRADLNLAKAFLEDFLADETTDIVTWELADEARVKVLGAIDSLRRWEKVTA